MRPRGIIRAPRGFTLLEVMAVVALMGLLAAATAWTLADDAQRATRDDVVGRLAHADHMARLSGRRLGASVLRIDLDRQRVVVVTADVEGHDHPSHTLRLPRGFRIERVEVVTASADRRADARPLERRVYATGVVEVPVSTTGRGPTYVIELAGTGIRDREEAQTSNRNNRRAWLLVSGLTGQATLEDDPNTIDNLLAALTARPDAD